MTTETHKPFFKKTSYCLVYVDVKRCRVIEEQATVQK